MKGIYIEDETRQAMFVKEMLEDEGHEFTHFRTVDEALQHLGFSSESKSLTKDLPTDLDFILTDNKTRSNYEGTDLIEVAKGKGVGLVLYTNSLIQESDFEKEFGKAPKLAFKLTDNKELPEIIKQSVQDAKLEKLGIQKSEGGKSV